MSAFETSNLPLVKACEERLINVWPALQTVLMGDWALRFARGYSGRANSASAFRPGADLDDAALAHVTSLYRTAGLVPAIRVSPLCAPGLAGRLAAAGWAPIVTSIGMVASANAGWGADPAVEAVATPARGWVEGVSAWQEERKRNAGDFAAILGQLRLPACFATIRTKGVAAGYGMGVCDREMAEIGSILLGPEHRGQGLGRRLVETLLADMRDKGAARVFLQVEENNAVAISLYRSLGFGEVYRYTEYRLIA